MAGAALAIATQAGPMARTGVIAARAGQRGESGLCIAAGATR